MQDDIFCRQVRHPRMLGVGPDRNPSSGKVTIPAYILNPE